MTQRTFKYWILISLVGMLLSLFAVTFAMAEGENSELVIELGERTDGKDHGFIGIIYPWIDYLGEIFPSIGKQPSIVITAIQFNSPAQKVGLIPGDVIKTVNGVKIFNGYLLRNVLQEFIPGDKITLGIQRLAPTPRDFIKKIKSHTDDPNGHGVPEFILGEPNRYGDFSESQSDETWGYERSISKNLKSNVIRAIKWYEKSIKKRNPEAMYSVAEILNLHSANLPYATAAAVFLAHAIQTGERKIYLRVFYQNTKWRAETITALKSILTQAKLYRGQIDGNFESNVFKTSLINLMNGKGKLPNLPLNEIQKLLK